MEYILKSTLILWILLISVRSAKIVIFQPMGSKSHKNAIRPIIHELASRGHDLTWVTCHPEPKLVSNLKEIVITKNIPLVNGIETQKVLFDSAIKNDKLAHLQTMYPMMVNSSTNFMNHPEIELLINKGMHFDVAIVNSFMNDIAMMISPVIARHVVSFSPAGFGSFSKSSPPFPLSAIATGEFPDDMSFLERVINVGLWNMMWTVFIYLSTSAANAIGREKYPNLPLVSEATNKISLNFANADPVLSTSRPGMPNYVDIGGSHCKPAMPLQNEFSDFVESSGDDGFIYFSLGSVVQAKNMPENIRLEFLKAFSSLKQKVIWKFEERMPNIPLNVMLTPWAPQQDLLGHPKIRLFFTHGGLLSSQEAIYHGVPVLGIAVFADQPVNIYRLTEKGVAESLDISNISAEVVKNSIEKIIQDPSYEQNMKKYSKIFRDQAQDPTQRAVFWIEHLLRYDNIDHLITSAVHLNNFQYFDLDIISVMFFVFVLTVFLVVRIGKFGVNKFLRTKHIKQK